MSRNKEFDVDTVLLQAMDLFWLKGYEKTSIQDLVDYMGIHRKSLYDTFGDKHELFLAAIDRYQEKISHEIERRIKTSRSAKDGIRSLLYMAMDEEPICVQGCLMVNSSVELSLHDEEVLAKAKESFERTEQLMLQLIQSGQNDGSIATSLRAEQLAQYFFNAWLGLRVMVKTVPDKARLGNIIDVTMSVLD